MACSDYKRGCRGNCLEIKKDRDGETRRGWRRLHIVGLINLYSSSAYSYSGTTRQTIAIKGSCFPSFGSSFEPHRYVVELLGR